VLPATGTTPVRLAVFDLDGTITRRDTLVPYVLGYLTRGNPLRWLSLIRVLRVLPTLAAFAIGRADHGRLKSELIKATLRGTTRAEIDGWTGQFVDQLLAHGVFADALQRVALHKREGARLVLLSASTDLYVPAIARALGFDEAICTGIRWDGDCLQGDLTTPNRRGAEKARCFEGLRQRHPGLVTAAYGNAGSDLDHLRLADRPLLVNGSARARRRARRLAIPAARWR